MEQCHGHSFVAIGETIDYRNIYVLRSERHFGDINPQKLGELFVEFLINVMNKYGTIEIVYCDSAESVLIRGLRASLEEARLNITIANAWKIEIINRIRLVNRLTAQSRLYYTEDCETFVNAMCNAVYNPKAKTRDERLDDGTSDIDTLDAFEYTIERDKDLLIISETR